MRALSARTSGVKQIGGFVRQLASKILGFGEDFSALEGFFDLRAIGRGDDVERFERFAVARGLVLVGLEVAEDGAFDGGFGVATFQ